MKTISVFCCLLYAAGIEGAAINAEGFEGGEVLFQCSHRFAWKNNKYLCKDPCKGSKDTLVTVESGRRAASGRISLVDSGDGVFTVTFSQLQLSDMGRYWCGVDRPGFDTFNAVQLTVKEGIAVANETTVIPELSPKWTYQNMISSTQSTSGIESTSNTTTGGEQNSSTGTVLYATAGAVAMLAILMLAVIVRSKSKPQGQVWPNGTVLNSAEQRELDGVHSEIDMQPIKTISERFSVPLHPKQDPPATASTAAESSVPIYENLRCSKGPAHSRQPAANARGKRDTSSRIYIKPLPRVSDRTGGVLENR